MQHYPPAEYNPWNAITISYFSLFLLQSSFLEGIWPFLEGILLPVCCLWPQVCISLVHIARLPWHRWTWELSGKLYSGNQYLDTTQSQIPSMHVKIYYTLTVRSSSHRRIERGTSEEYSCNSPCLLWCCLTCFCPASGCILQILDRQEMKEKHSIDFLSYVWPKCHVHKLTDCCV